jgi:membrane-associated phospholipid phosphatase
MLNKKNLKQLTCGLAIIFLCGYLLSFLINADLDWQILNAINPDYYIPVLDEFMVFITDFSMYLIGALAIFWEIGFQVSKKANNAEKTEKIKLFMRILGGLLGIGALSGYFWADYDYAIVFVALGFFILIGFYLIGESYEKMSKEDQITLNRVFWCTLFAVGFSSLFESIVKALVKRPRPLNIANVAFNQNIRIFEDEISSHSYSFYSGHSSALFALLTPLAWAHPNKKVKIILILWAAIHAFSRVYLAAHFPFCALVGSLAGFCLGTLFYQTFGKSPEKNDI